MTSLLDQLGHLTLQLHAIADQARHNGDLARTRTDLQGLADHIDRLCALTNKVFWEMAEMTEELGDPGSFDADGFNDPERRLLTDVAAILSDATDEPPGTMRFSFTIPRGHAVMAAGLQLALAGDDPDRLAWSNEAVAAAADEDWDKVRTLARPMLDFLLQSALRQTLDQLTTGGHPVFWPDELAHDRFKRHGLGPSRDDDDEIPF